MLLLPCGSFLAAQTLEYNQPGSHYTQHFDDLPSSGSIPLSGKGPFLLAETPFLITGLQGWQVWMREGSGSNAVFTAGTGSATGNGIYSLGTAGSTDRALGSLSSGSGIYSFGLVLTNRTGSLLNTFTLTFTAEQWRKGGSGNANTWSFSYKAGPVADTSQAATIAVPQLDMRSVIMTTGGSALNGNLPENSRNISFTVNNINWKPGEQLMLRWNDADENGSDDICALDDLSFSASMDSSLLVPEPQDTLRTADTTQPPDTVPPFITRIGLPPARTFIAGDSLLFLFHFSEPVLISASGGMLSFSMVSGSRSKAVTCLSEGGSDSLWFRYIIPEGESDRDGIRINTPVSFSNGSITDSAGNPLVTASVFPSMAGIRIDAVRPAISEVTTPAPAGYRTGNMLDFIIRFSKKVFASASDTSLNLSVVIGDHTREAVYINGSGTTEFLFRYRIQYEDSDKDGIKLLSVNHSMPVTDEVGNTADLTQHNIGALSKVLVNPPSASILQTDMPGNGWYKNGDTLSFFIHTSEPVWIDTKNGLPLFKFTAGSKQKQADYIQGSGTDLLLFQYIVQAADLDTNGITPAPSLSLNKSAIVDERGDPLPPALAGIPGNMHVLLDGTGPSVKSVKAPAQKTYRIGDTLLYGVVFNEGVYIHPGVDTPYLVLRVGDIQKKAVYTGYEGSTVYFCYRIGDNDLDNNGVFADTIVHASADFISDKAGNFFLPALKNISAQSRIYVDGVVPVFVTRTDTVMVCRNDTTLIQSQLQASGSEKGEPFTWTVIKDPNKGILSAKQLEATTNGTVASPEPVSYTPYRDITGLDSFRIELSDGIYRSVKTIYIQVLPGIDNNTIIPSQIICSNEQPRVLTGTLPTGGMGKYQYTWEASIQNDISGFTKAGDQYASAFLPGKLTADTWFRRKIISGPCIRISLPVKITVLKNGVWTGSYDTDWNNPNNWCNNTIPDSSTDVLISAASPYMPQIEDTAIARNILLDSSTLLTVAGKLSISGGLQDRGGKVRADSGALVFNGTSLQMLDAAVLSEGSVKDITINNPKGVEVANDLLISHRLILVDKSTFTTHNHVWLQENACIGPSGEASSVLGNISIRRRIPAGKNTWILMGHPFKESIGLYMISDSIDLSGNTVNDPAPPVTTTPAASWYDYRLGNDSTGFASGWVPFTGTQASQGNEWEPFSGIRLLANRQGLASDKKYTQLLFTGPVHTGQLEYELPGSYQGNYHVLANPYPSAIDLGKLSKAAAIGNCFWIWNAQQGHAGGYSCIPFGTSYILPSFGAFIVKSYDTAHNAIMFTENMKSEYVADDLLPPASFPEDFIELRLYQDSIFYDRLLIRGVDSAWVGIDRLDGEKIPNPGTSLYSLSRENKPLSVDTRPLNAASQIPLGITGNEPGSFSIRMHSLRLPPGSPLQLHDRYMRKWLPLHTDSSYHFQVTDDTASFGEHRFEITAYYREPDTAIATRLVMHVAPVPATHTISVQFRTWEKGSTLIRLLTQQGYPLRQYFLGAINQGTCRIPISDLPAGVYLLELRCGSQVSVQRVIKQ